MNRVPRLFYLRDPSQFPPFWTGEDERVFYTKFNNAEDDDGYFKLLQFTIPHLKKISHEIETNLMSDKDYGSMRKKGLRQRQQYYTPVWGPLNVEALGFSIPSLNREIRSWFCVCLHIVISKTYGVGFQIVFFCLHLVSSVPNVASFTGLSFLIALSIFSNIYIHCSVLMYKMKYYIVYLLSGNQGRFQDFKLGGRI